jgi:hypothetical protein
MACFGPAPGDPAVGQQRPCHSDYLPLSQGDSGFFQPDGFASFAGQTKQKPALKRVSNKRIKFATGKLRLKSLESKYWQLANI